MRVAIGNDHVGLSLKPAVMAELEKLGVEVINAGVDRPERVDYPDYAAKVGRLVQSGAADRGILICGSGVGMCIAVNKLHGIRASVAHDVYSAHQGVEHDDMNVLCLGSQTTGAAVAGELVSAFVSAQFNQVERFALRIRKIAELEQSGAPLERADHETN